MQYARALAYDLNLRCAGPWRLWCTVYDLRLTGLFRSRYCCGDGMGTVQLLSVMLSVEHRPGHSQSGFQCKVGPDFTLDGWPASGMKKVFRRVVVA